MEGCGTVGGRRRANDPRMLRDVKWTDEDKNFHSGLYGSSWCCLGGRHSSMPAEVVGSGWWRQSACTGAIAFRRFRPASGKRPAAGDTVWVELLHDVALVACLVGC